MTAALRVVIVDDEPLAREGLRLRLSTDPGVTIVAECENGAEAARAFACDQPDVVFLDVNMPDLDGFTLLDRTERDELPGIVFVTAYAEHALRAFRARALDYLVKPYDDEQLAESVRRARDYVARLRESAAARAMHRVLRDADASGTAARLAIKTPDRVVLLDPGEIAWFEAAGDYVRVHAANGVHLARSSLRDLEARLDPRRFVRIHRTAIVAIPGIKELQPYFRGAYVVVLRNGTKLTMSRRFRTRVAAALGLSL